MRALLPVALGILGLTACSFGRVIDKQTMRNMAPRMMQSSDIDSACEVGSTMAPLIEALGKEGKRAYKSLVLTGTSAAMCADLDVWEIEVQRLSAVSQGDGVAATDLLEAEKRMHERAARRYLSAWEALTMAWPETPVGSQCPDLKEKDNDDLVYLLGLTSGVLAVLHDRAAGGVVGADLAIPRMVERGATCVDDDEWWGAPSALRAAVWASVPGAGPEGADPLATLAAAADKGEAAHVRLSRALQVQTLSSLGDEAALAGAIAAHADSLAGEPPDEAWRLLDRYATLLIRHESDKRWARAEGYRTPSGQLGTLPGVESAADDAFDALLDDLIPEPEPAPEQDEETP